MAVFLFGMRERAPKQGDNIHWQPDSGHRPLLGFDGNS
jgi:hypothetical protein